MLILFNQDLLVKFKTCVNYRKPIGRQGDLKWREKSGIDCQVKLLGYTTSQLLKYTFYMFRFQIYIRVVVFITKHIHKILTGFIKKNKKYNRLNTAEWISISTILLSAGRLK